MRSRPPGSWQAWKVALGGGLIAFALSVGVLAFVVADAVRPAHGRTRAAAAVAPSGGRPAPSPASDDAAGEAPGQPAPEAVAFEDAALAAVIEATLGPDIEHFSVAVRRLNDGRGASINAGTEYYAASLFKLAVAYEAERRRSEGSLDFDQPLQITEADAAEDLGTLGDLELSPEGTLSIGAAVAAMITISDNSTAVALLHLLGGDAIDQTLLSLGLTHTSVNTIDLPTSAGDMALLMAAIVNGQGLGPDESAELRALLRQQRTRDGIPSVIPAGIDVGNKTGTWPGATHDVAFVDAPRGRYVIAVLSDRDWDWEPIARLSRAVFEEMERT